MLAAVQDVNVAALYAGLALVGVAAVVAGLAALATRPRRPPVGEPTMELGDESPAVVDLVTDDFEVTPEAVPATLIDLSARRWLDLDSVGDEVVCRPRTLGRGGLKPYEQRVLDHVCGLATDGVVPAAALTTGPEAASKSWWKSFAREVVEDAKARGLCRRRWPPWVAGLVSFLVLVAGATLFVADIDESDQDGGPLIVALILGLVVMGSVSGKISASSRQRETDAGLEVASRWLGVRQYLADHGDFANQPASAVAVWDRYLAYAAALDLATTAVEQLPLGAEDDRHAWSSFTGKWRQVTVDYPRFRPGWGRHPAAAVTLGLLGAAVSGAVIWLSYQVSQDTTMDGALDGLEAGTRDRIGWVALLVCLVFAAPFAYALVELWRGIADAVADRTVQGVVLRCRARTPGLQPPKVVRYFTDPARRGRKDREPRWYVAVDDGAFDRVDAWRVRRARYQEVRQHQRVRAELTPRLGYVRSFQPLVAGPQATEPATETSYPVVKGSGADALRAAAEALRQA